MNFCIVSVFEVIIVVTLFSIASHQSQLGLSIFRFERIDVPSSRRHMNVCYLFEQQSAHYFKYPRLCFGRCVASSSELTIFFE